MGMAILLKQVVENFVGFEQRHPSRAYSSSPHKIPTVSTLSSDSKEIRLQVVKVFYVRCLEGLLTL
jgi:hypothetical protein